MLTQTIPSYLYTHFQDDADLQAFVTVFNQMAQQYVTWFASIGLPVYTGDQIAADLLDWVAEGLYGMARPSLPAGTTHIIGPYNTARYNQLAYNQRRDVGTSTYYSATDDIFKRCLTWNFYKGDGTTFDIRWLKRRIMRFLNGPNGTDPGVDQTYPVSITFGAGNQVNILLNVGGSQVTNSSMFNELQYDNQMFNEIDINFTPPTPQPFAPILKSAIDAGVLLLPFQYTYVVAI